MASSLFPPLPSLFLSPKPPNPNSPPNPNFPSNPNSHFRPLLSSRRNTPETECPVPLDQQPVNEFKSLSETLPFSWANGGMRRYCSRLAFTGVGFAVFIGLPVAVVGKGYGDPQVEAVRLALGAGFTGLLAVTLAVLRMYLGWAYVGNRLLSATVEYEETGWYDGEIWVKTPEVLARDRLLGSYSVKPVLNRVKLTLVGLAISLVACGIVFVNIEPLKRSTTSDAPGGRAVSGVYDDASARSFEPDAFCGDSSQTERILSCTF